MIIKADEANTIAIQAKNDGLTENRLTIFALIAEAAKRGEFAIESLAHTKPTFILTNDDVEYFRIFGYKVTQAKIEYSLQTSPSFPVHLSSQYLVTQTPAIIDWSKES